MGLGNQPFFYWVLDYPDGSTIRKRYNGAPQPPRVRESFAFSAGTSEAPFSVVVPETGTPLESRRAAQSSPPGDDPHEIPPQAVRVSGWYQLSSDNGLVDRGT